MRLPVPRPRLSAQGRARLPLCAFMLATIVAGCRFGVSGLGDDLGAGDGAVGDDAGDAGDSDGLLDANVDQAPPLDLFMGPDGLKPGEVGWPCAQAFECGSGFCVSGVCCEELCDALDPANLCKACNVPGFEGRCVQVLDGTDPRGQCAEEPVETCGRDGLCEGSGRCRKWGAGTQCGLSSCASGVVTYPPACNGLGACLTGNTQPCGPYDCGSLTACATSCTGVSTGCALGAVCTNGSCGKRADGQPCSAPGECINTHCEQGVCCASDCAQTCFACNLPGSVGQCRVVPAGADPLSQCAAETRASCGRDGACDGAGGCRRWVLGTPCAGSSCAADATVSARSCDGAGTCLAGSITDCGTYACNGANGTCYTRCTANSQCEAGRLCRLKNGKCM